ncbi:MAG: hypothetical protein PHE53_14055, partial [Thermoguttaceae bacterium]|nr:hypothetical protein [Thermoguttaceae bacterium]
KCGPNALTDRHANGLLSQKNRGNSFRIFKEIAALQHYALRIGGTTRLDRLRFWSGWSRTFSGKFNK